MKKSSELTFVRKVLALKKAGIGISPPIIQEQEELISLEERCQKLLGIVRERRKSTDMVFFVMYDIENDKVRRYVSKYLEKKGYLRVQKSVFLGKADRNEFNKIGDTLRKVNEIYENEDSIVLIPVSSDELTSMELIGKDVNIKAYYDKPGTLFF